jgi:hypothetical protein
MTVQIVLRNYAGDHGLRFLTRGSDYGVAQEVAKSIGFVIKYNYNVKHR